MNLIGEDKFPEQVLLPSFTNPIVVMFGASWCAPCKLVKPILEGLALDLGFPLIGVDAGIEKGLATFYGVRGVPTISVFKDGKIIANSFGNKSEEQIKDFLFKAGVTQITLPGF